MELTELKQRLGKKLDKTVCIALYIVVLCIVCYIDMEMPTMDDLNLDNWKAQIRRGYLELNILMIIKLKERIYGFDLIEELKKYDLPIKEGTLYPLLNRMTTEGMLSSVWETENTSGHPRKFYSLTQKGVKILNMMQEEYDKMWEIYCELKK